MISQKIIQRISKMFIKRLSFALKNKISNNYVMTWRRSIKRYPTKVLVFQAPKKQNFKPNQSKQNYKCTIYTNKLLLILYHRRVLLVQTLKRQTFKLRQTIQNPNCMICTQILSGKHLLEVLSTISTRLKGMELKKRSKNRF